MSAKKYIPNRLRGVLGGDDSDRSASPSTKSSMSRGKGRKTRPWRVDAASWKQQLQERKAVYDNFALPEKNEEKESSSHMRTIDKEGEELEAIPLNVLTSTNAGGGGQVETMLTPRKGGQVETVYTSASKTSSASESASKSASTTQPASSPSPSSVAGNEKIAEKSGDDGGSLTSEKSRSSRSSRSSSSPSKKKTVRRPSPLPRSKSKSFESPKRKGKKLPTKSQHRTNRNNSFDDDNVSSNDDEEHEDWASRSSDSCDSVEYFVDGVELMASKSKDSNIGIANGIAHVTKPKIKSKRHREKTRARLLRHGDSDDTAESVGLPEDYYVGESSSYTPVNKSSMMEAVEDFIDPSLRTTNKSNFKFPSQITTENDIVVDVDRKDIVRSPRSPIFANRSVDGVIVIRDNPNRRGGRRRQRSSQNTTPEEPVMPLLSPATSTTSTTGMIMGNYSRKDPSFRRRRTIPDSIYDENNTKSNNPMKKVEDDADTATTHSGDTDIVSVMNDVMVNQEENKIDSKNNPDGKEDSKQKDEQGSEERPGTTPKAASPDPLQRARKSLLVSNLNRSVRSLLDASNNSFSSRQGDDEINESGIESSFSKSMFVPLRSRRQDYSLESNDVKERKSEVEKEIPLNVLDDHGVYVSKYNENGIFVPPHNDPVQSVKETSQRAIVEDVYNEHGAYVPNDEDASLPSKTAGGKDRKETRDASHTSVSSPPPESTNHTDKTLGNAQQSTTVDVDKQINNETKETRDVLELDEVNSPLVQEGKEIATGNEIVPSNEQLQSVSLDSKESDDSETVPVASSVVAVTQENKESEFDREMDSHDNSPNTIQDGIVSLASEKKIEDNTDKMNDVNDDDDDGCDVDEIDANRIRLISDLKRRVNSIYTGNHVCVESIGTSTDPDPLATSRLKRLAVKKVVHTNLNVQLNDTVSTLNRDHHHVVESSGQIKSLKGMKWKERMAMKKLSKKSGTEAKGENLQIAAQESSDANNSSISNKAEKDEVDEDDNISTSSEHNLVSKTKQNQEVDLASPEIIPDAVDSASGLAEKANIVLVTTDPNKTKCDLYKGVENVTAISTSDEAEDKSPDTNYSTSDIVEKAKGANILFITEEPKKIDVSDANSDTYGSPSDVSEKAKNASIIFVSKESKKMESKNIDRTDNRADARDLSKKTTASSGNAENTDVTTQNNALDTVTPEIPNVNLSSNKFVHATNDTQEDPSSILSSTPDQAQETKLAIVDPNSENAKEIVSSIEDNGIDTASFAISDEHQVGDTELPIPENNTNIIQGLPPNKGKKWKDRLNKKKNKKSEKNGTAKAKENSESGECDSENIGAGTAEHEQGSTLISPSSSVGDDPENSEARPPFKRNLSDLTAEEKTREVSPVNEEKIEPSTKTIGKKSNKWKNRLAKIKGTKQDNTKSPQPNEKEEELSAPSGEGLVKAEPNSSDVPTGTKTGTSLETSTRGQILVDFKSNSTEQQDGSDGIRTDTEKSVALTNAKQDFETIQVPAPFGTNVNPAPPDAAKKTVENGSKIKNSDLQNLRQSFDVFDAFLQNGHTNQIDDESIYTEMTIGQETYLQSGPVVDEEYEEEQSYMDFTLEESVQPSFVEQKTTSNIPPKEAVMSPFMANLLSSRMFQDPIPQVSKMSLPQEDEHQKQSKLAENSDENLKKYPSITVVDAFDDDMTQITMGSLEENQNGEEDVDEETFFDAESNAIPTSPSSRSISKKSKKSLTESVSSHSSQLSLSEASKQRIVDILRKEVWSRDIDVVKSAMEELDTEAKNGLHHRAHIVRCGGVMTIMRAMEMNSNSETIQIASCSTLEKLALDPQTQTTICEMEGVSLIVRSMQAHFESVELQEVACMALATICRQQEAVTSKDSMKDAEEAVPTILSCMTRYSTNSRIQAKGFQAIANLCSGDHAQERLAELSKAGGIMTLTMALQTPWENKNDQHEAISNLSILLRGMTELSETPLVGPADNEAVRSLEPIETSSGENESKPPSQQDFNYVSDNETVTSYMEEIPNLPLMSTTSVNVDDIPDLDEYPTIMSDLAFQNFGEDDLDAGRKDSTDANAPGAANGRKGANEEQCVIQ